MDFTGDWFCALRSGFNFNQRARQKGFGAGAESVAKNKAALESISGALAADGLSAQDRADGLTSKAAAATASTTPASAADNSTAQHGQ